MSMVSEAVRWQDQKLSLLDQRLLPHKQAYSAIETLDDAIENIKRLSVRGAPAIGIAAAYALCVSARQYAGEADFDRRLDIDFERLIAARPTAVNLRWAATKVREAAINANPGDALAKMIEEAETIHADDRAACRRIGEAGLSVLAELTPRADGALGLITHCNAGALAVSELGTATAPMYLAHAEGQKLHVYADETRPLLQGARLTAWELDQAGIPVTLLCDNAAASLLASGEVQAAIVGTDRVAANGDVANKIGTFPLAMACQHFGIPFFVACPSSTFDGHSATGADIPIEHRSAEEVIGSVGASVDVYNPAFDITPATMVTAFLTDRGVLRPPFADSLNLLRE
ncbi:MAG: S-methyl-5-thioribose-1-phosphate isomerase [Pseudomonadaceae bacterium]|nr:S-methyl-5-thioribose-1-phosphate isomerase [Pseudomonadaceae bacterium]